MLWKQHWHRGVRLGCVKPSSLTLPRLLDPFAHCIPAGQWPPPAHLQDLSPPAWSQLTFNIETAMRSHHQERWGTSPNLRTGGREVTGQFSESMDKLCLASRQTEDTPRKMKMEISSSSSLMKVIFSFSWFLHGQSPDTPCFTVLPLSQPQRAPFPHQLEGESPYLQAAVFNAQAV